MVDSIRRQLSVNFRPFSAHCATHVADQNQTKPGPRLRTAKAIGVIFSPNFPSSPEPQKMGYSFDVRSILKNNG